jgi:hypothetical protein
LQEVRGQARFLGVNGWNSWKEERVIRPRGGRPSKREYIMKVKLDDRFRGRSRKWLLSGAWPKVGLAAFLCSLAISVDAAPLDSWHIRRGDPVPISRPLNDVIYANGRFVAVGDGGVIATSEDGLVWSQRSGQVNGNGSLRAITFGGGMYVAVGDWGTILTSPDGLRWTQRDSGTGTILWDVVYGAGRFVAATYLEPWYLTSTNRIDWSRVDVEFGLWSLHSLAYGNGHFVDAAGLIFRSSNGIAWEESHGGYGTVVAYGGGAFLAFDLGSVCSSSNGLDWECVAQTNIFDPRALGFGENRFVAVGVGEGPSDLEPWRGAILVSTNRLDWTRAEVGTNAADLTGISCGDGLFVAVGRDASDPPQPVILTSPDGFAWSEVPRPPPSVPVWWSSVAYGNGFFVASGSRDADSVLFTSTDGGVWNERNLGTNNLGRIKFGHNLFVSVAGQIRTSPDGVDWTVRYASTNGVYDLAFANGTFFTMGYNSTITSTNGIEWTEHPDATGPLPTAFGNSKYLYASGWCLFGGCYTEIRSSINGLDWTSPLHPPCVADAATFGKGRFVAAGFYEGSLGWFPSPPCSWLGTSTDGATWMSVEGPVLHLLSYANGVFLGARNSGEGLSIYASSDGTNWAHRWDGPMRLWQNNDGGDSVVFGNGTFVLLVGSGMILQSDPFVSLDVRMTTEPELTIGGPLGRACRIEWADTVGATNSWQTLATLTTTNETHVFGDTSATGAVRRFYRAVLLPE